MAPNNNVGMRPSSAVAESVSRPQSRVAKEKRFSFVGGFDFLPTGRPSTSHHRNKPSTDTSNTLVFSPTCNKLRKQGSIKNRSKINTSTLREKSSFNVSPSSICPTTPQSPLQSLSTKYSPKPFLSSEKKPAMELSVARAKRTRGCGAMLRKIFSCTKEEAIDPQGPTKLEIKTKTVTIGTGSDLRDLRFYQGNESLRICRQLCRIQDEDEKSIHILSHRIGSLPFKVRQFDTEDAPHTLLLPATVLGNEADDYELEMMKVFMENFISMLPNGTDKISRKANPSGLVFRLLPSPIIPPAARYLGAAFWLWLCAIDDQIEELEQSEFEKAIDEIKIVFNYEDRPLPDSRVAQTSLALRDLVDQTELKTASTIDFDEHTWRRSFLDAIMEILYAFEGERPLLAQFKEGNEFVQLSDWMVLRVVTISARPFMVLARASLGLQPNLSTLGNTLKSGASGAVTRRGRSDSAQTYTPDLEWEDDISRLEILAQYAMGLENDILGWEKDHAEQNILNSVEILFQRYQHRQSAMREMVLIHNYTVNKLCLLGETILSKYTGDIHSLPVSPARTLFRRDSIRSPRSPLPLGLNTMFTAPDPNLATENETRRTETKIIRRIKSIVQKPIPTSEKDTTSSKQAQYTMVLFSFVQGMAVWTSKAKRYAI
ncbi:hypothetical protein H072_820 [Dactylellina haptotyla CBS 200.50]|uniref:Uncharacterized protein n=1 Tax=Dactylellina haptotyla (strain CBS 200.50) TaxID=1284197 RepID=S8AW20_DACHA|nr:hypothetical protein H072_820 [Dactylellina haptotyla CBS 200.50]